MQPITKEHIRSLNATASVLGLKQRDTKDDDYHAILYRMTGKTSTKDLTEMEFLAVLRELRTLGDGQATTPVVTSKKPPPDTPVGMMTRSRIGKAWGVFYELKALDLTPSTITDRERMKCIIKRVLGMDTTLEGDLFKWITAKQGDTLIRALQNMVIASKKKAGDA